MDSFGDLNVSNKNNYRFLTGEILVLFFCFLGALNFINRYYYCFFIAFLAMIVFYKVKIPNNTSVVLLSVLAVSILLFSDFGKLSLMTAIKPFIYLVSYLIGHNLMRIHSKHTKDKYINYVIIMLSLGCLLHYLLNWSINVDAVYRNTNDFWTGDILSATGQMSFACYSIAVSCALYFSNQKTKYKILAIVSLVCVLAYNIILAGRTLLIMILIMIAVALLFYILNNRSSKNIRLLIALLFVFAVLFILYSFDFMNIKTLFENSNLYYRFFDTNSAAEFDQDLRMYFKGNYISNLVRYPFGGGHIRQIVGGYAHDLYLDTYDEVGVIGFIAIVIFIINSIKNMFSFVTDKSIKFGTRQIVLCIYVVANIEFFIEPILAGIPWFLAIYCLIDGMVVYYLSNKERAPIHENS